MSMDKAAFQAEVRDIVEHSTQVLVTVEDRELKYDVAISGPAVDDASSELYDNVTAKADTTPPVPTPPPADPTPPPVEPTKPLPTPTTNDPTPPTGDISGTHADKLEVSVISQNAQQPTKPVVTVRVKTKIAGDTLDNQIIDVEAWSQDGLTKRAQLFATNQHITHDDYTEYAATLPVMEPGTYEVRVGIFDGPTSGYDWGTKRYFGDKAGTVVVTAAAPYVPPAGANTSELYRAPQSVDSYVAAYPATGKIAAQPSAKWMGDWSGPIQAAIEALMSGAGDKIAQAIAYNIPNRDAGQYSAGGLATYGDYKQWIYAFAQGLGNKKAFIVLEPDAIGHYDLLSETERAQRADALLYGITVLTAANPISRAMLDASMWVPVAEQARRLKACGMAKAKMFSVNVSGYEWDATCESYGDALVAELAQVHGITGVEYAVDTSRNGNGPTGDWCNPPGRALGKKPGPVNDPAHPAHTWNLWLKTPGESDGTCNGGPSAGQFWPERAVELVNNAKW